MRKERDARWEARQLLVGKGQWGGAHREHASVVAMPVETWCSWAWASLVWMLGRRANWEQRLAWARRTFGTQFETGKTEMGERLFSADVILAPWQAADPYANRMRACRGIKCAPFYTAAAGREELTSRPKCVAADCRQGSYDLCPVLHGYLWVRRKMYCFVRSLTVLFIVSLAWYSCVKFLFCSSCTKIASVVL